MSDVNGKGPMQVVGWAEWFESAKSKTYKHRSQCYMPNKHGLGFRRLIAAGKDGPALFGAWCAMCQILSRQDSPREGYLTDTGRISGRYYTASDLSILTGIPKMTFERMLTVTASESVGWLQGYHKDTTVSDGASSEGEGEGEGEGKGCADFDAFWKAYPSKVAKKAALKAWRNAKDKPPIAEIVAAVMAQRQSEKWRKDGGQYVPNPTTWINQGRWADELTVAVAAPPRNFI